MKALVERPLSPAESMVAATAVVAATAAYCFAYNLLAGSPEPIADGVLWAAINLLPWLFALELAKKIGNDPAGTWSLGWSRIGAILLGAAAVSVAAELLVGRIGLEDLGFALVRRLPAALLIAAVLLVVALLPRGRAESPAVVVGPVAGSLDLALLPRQIDWIRSAGNYLEVRGTGRVVLQRMTLAAAERMLHAEGFVRIHRCALVNGRRIARYRAGKMADELQLEDGTWLKVGGAYRPLVRRRLNRLPS